MARLGRNPGKQAGLNLHSDRGTVTAEASMPTRTSVRYSKKHGITPSMGRKGNCWDNACSERLPRALKVERLHGQCFRTIREVKDRVIAWLLRYNRIRMHSPLNYISPVEFEEDWSDAKTKIAA